METRRLGSTDLMVSELGLGCARLGGLFQKHPEGLLELLHVARDRGITFFDTADIYAQGESERLLGKAFRRRRDRVVIATKAGYGLPAQRQLIAKLKPLVRPIVKALKLRRDQLPGAVRGELSQDFSPAHLERAVEGSLKRLRTDYVDLLQLHSPPAEVIERGDFLPALERLKREGKVRYYGISCDTLEAGFAALRHPGVSSLQVMINLLEPGAAAELIPRASSQGVGVIARECLANGLLAKPREELDLSKYCSSKEEEARREAQLAERRAEAAAIGRPLPALAVDFVRTLPGVSVTLLGASRVDQLTSVLRAAYAAPARSGDVR